MTLMYLIAHAHDGIVRLTRVHQLPVAEGWDHCQARWEAGHKPQEERWDQSPERQGQLHHPQVEHHDKLVAHHLSHSANKELWKATSLMMFVVHDIQFLLKVVCGWSFDRFRFIFQVIFLCKFTHTKINDCSDKCFSFWQY